MLPRDLTVNTQNNGVTIAEKATARRKTKMQRSVGLMRTDMSMMVRT